MHPNDGRVVSNFILQALAGQDITVYGDGSQTRSFCFVDDLIDGLIALMESDDDVIGPVNLGNPHEMSIKELAEHVINELRGIKLIYKDLPMDDPKQRKPDIALANKVLDWNPSVSFEEGIKRTTDYFREKMSQA